MQKSEEKGINKGMPMPSIGLFKADDDDDDNNDDVTKDQYLTTWFVILFP